eukprot:scaffold2501_cov174-Amphora_coffeaeformis.AAC.13
MTATSSRSRVLLPWIISFLWLHSSLCLAPAANNKSHPGTGHPTRLFVKNNSNTGDSSLGKILVLGGTGFLGQAVCKRALAEGFQVTSLSRRGLPPPSYDEGRTLLSTTFDIDFRQGDVRNKASISNILSEGGYTGIVHCIGLLLDEDSGLSLLNQFVSGSRSIPDADSTYDTITRLTAFNAIEMATEYALSNNLNDFAFCFTSAAEAGWPDVLGGVLVEGILPDFMKRYLVAKRAVEAKINEAAPTIRPIIVRPSLIYSMDRPESFFSVSAFFAGNTIGLPFIDKPVTVQALASTMVKALKDKNLSGVLRYPDIERMGGSS